AAPARTAIASGTALVREMRARYADDWFHTVTFTQRTTITLPSGTQSVQTWYEAARPPGELRIDIGNPSQGSGILFARDSVFTFASGRLVKADTGTNELLVLAFDAYAQPPARTEAQLRRLGFDLARVHETTWHGRPVYVVGALAGDTTSKQFWVDRERLVLVRLIEHNRQGRGDYQLDRFEPAGGGWIAQQVEQLVNGKRRVLEEYSNVRANVGLSPTLFDPSHWTTAPHWAHP
ncbi:MAG TPA: hypothetical protein VHB25_09390, partial [Gemmatimonadaceae bacterium]|nr:hypothetical protein [Gemmatimonadaceae bacterium]